MLGRIGLVRRGRRANFDWTGSLWALPGLRMQAHVDAFLAVDLVDAFRPMARRSLGLLRRVGSVPCRREETARQTKSRSST
jgi:hypothetical protein